MSEKKKDENKKGIYEPAYTAFLPIGITFLTLGITVDSMRSFLPVGIVFLIIGITYGIPWQKTNNEFTKQENTDTDTTVDNNVPPQNEN